jgi:riboflavin kinase/FMN adenylyltransferase
VGTVVLMHGTALTIGNFDGVHLGHAALIAAARHRVGKTGRVVAMSFDPPPAVVLRPSSPCSRLTTMDRRIELLKACGVDDVIVQAVDHDWLEQSPESFVLSSVVPQRPDVVVEGADFRFGHRRAGDIESLSQFGQLHGFEVETVPAVLGHLSNLESVPVRSSGIRWLLERGRVQDAAKLLGRPWRMEGTVVRGDQRGREIGCPTANLIPDGLILPADGVYGGTTEIDGQFFPVAVSIGTKPTFEGEGRVFEAHVIGWDGQLDYYGWPLAVDLHRWIRGQVKFDSIDRLCEQIAQDIAAAVSVCNA